MYKILILIFIFSINILAVDNSGKITYIEKSVKKNSNGGEWNNTNIGAKVVSGDKVRTYSKSRAEISLENLSVIRLAPKTTLNIEKLFEESANKKVTTVLDVEKGEIWSNTDKLKDDLEFDVNTDVAGMAIKGTIFRVIKKDNGDTKLKVYRGKVAIKSRNNDSIPKKYEVGKPKEIFGPKEVNLKTWLEVVQNMQEIEVSKDGLMLFKRNFDFTSKEETSDWAKWNKKRDRELKKEKMAKKAKKIKKELEKKNEADSLK